MPNKLNLPTPLANLLSIVFAATFLATLLHCGVAAAQTDEPPANPTQLEWTALPDLPNKLGVAGPFVGVHNQALIVAGGANFPTPVWESQKRWTDQIWVLTRTELELQWSSGGDLPRPLAYGAAVSTDSGMVCIGGNDSNRSYREVFRLQWNSVNRKVIRSDLPDLPMPLAYGQATIIDNVIYVAGGQSGPQLDSAMNQLWSLDLALQAEPENTEPEKFLWRELPAVPAPVRAFNITTQQHNGDEHCVYVIGGRYQMNDQTLFLKDVWEFSPKHQSWRRRADAPRSITAGTGIGFGKNQILVLSGDDGALFNQTESLRDQHPGFRKEALSFNAMTNSWATAGATPQNQVTTIPVIWNDRIIIASGEVRPRVRTPAVWSIEAISTPNLSK